MKYDTLLVHNKESYVIIELNNGKVNAINTQLLVDLKSVFRRLSEDNDVGGVILSGRPHAFSAGLDVMHLASMTDEEGISFWIHYMNVLEEMVTFPKPLICAITGYAPAGATILTLCTDYRIMGQGNKHVIGMHEFRMHMQIPEMLCDVYAYHLGEVQAWKAVQLKRLYNSDEALELGLVDESVDVEEVLMRAESVIKELIEVYPKVYATSKSFFKKKLYQIVSNRDVEGLARDAIEFSKDPHLKAKMTEFMLSLKKK